MQDSGFDTGNEQSFLKDEQWSELNSDEDKTACCKSNEQVFQGRTRDKHDK